MKDFVPPGTRKNYAPDRPVAVAHLRLEIELDLPDKTLVGRVSLSVQVRAATVTAVTLDAVDMDIQAVNVDGKAVRDWHYDDRKLRVPLPSARDRGDEFTITVQYRATPVRGLYFIAPDKAHPERPLQCWTQGQDEDARHFVPCIDSPIEKATTEVICTAPRGKFFLSNGDLIENTDLDDQRTRWHYRLSAPHSSYLITLVCGEFSQIETRAPETGVAVHYFVPPERQGDATPSLGKTPAMIDYFSRRIGIPYPHKRYSQVVVHDFIFGGMENTTATTLVEDALLDERATLDCDVEDLVAHELAHQWWGDLITCREWSEAWLNEGFATYFEYVWYEHDRDRDEADYHLLHHLDHYLSEAGHYQRPIVCRQYREPIELFDAHLYEKGSRVLHMLRQQVGDADFFAALQLYGRRHANGNAETRDLAHAFEETTGISFAAFFEQWVGTPGHLELECGWNWDDERGVGVLNLKQTQSPDDRVYRFSARMEFQMEDGDERTRQTINVSERSHVFEFRLPRRPLQVLFDPGQTLVATVKMDKARPLWAHQLAHAPLAIDRVAAARALADMPEPRAVAALAQALRKDRFWAVRGEAATALGKLARADGLTALLEAQSDPHPKVRRQVAAALGGFRHGDGAQQAADALIDWLKAGDPSGLVEAAAAESLGATRDERALSVLPDVMKRPAFRDAIRVGGLTGLGRSGHARAIDLVVPWLDDPRSYRARRAAALALGALAEGTDKTRAAREWLAGLLNDTHFMVRMAAADALVRLRDRRAETELQAALQRETDGRARRGLDGALTALREGQTPGEEMRRLREDLETVRQQTRELRERLEPLEAARNPAEKTTATGSHRTGRGAGPTKRPRPATRRSPKKRRPPRR